MVSKQNKSAGGNRSMLFSAWNYKVMSLGLAMVVIGFIAMYMENEVQGIISLFISPLLILTGYITVIFAIMKHDRGEKAAQGKNGG